MEGASSKIDGADMVPLSLMSKFCDKFCDKLSGSCADNLNCDKSDNSLFSGVFSYNALTYSTYKPKRREHSSNVVSFGCDSTNCADFGEPLAQQLVLKRKIPLSKHIKPEKLSKYVTDDVVSEVDLDDSCAGYPLDSDIQTSNSFVKRRLKSYLPALKRHVQGGEWAHLDEFPSLASLYTEGTSTSHHEIIYNSYKCTSHWDSQQAHLISSTPSIMVFYGITCKSNAIDLKRLKRLFVHAGVAPLPLQNMQHQREQLYLQDGHGRIQLNDLSGKLSYKNTISGIPVGIIGRVSRTKLNVEDVVFATTCSPEWPIPSENNIEMVFVSGLYFGSDASNTLALDLLQDYLLGLVGSANEQQEIIASRVRLFILGNSISKGNEQSTVEDISKKCSMNMAKLDNFLEPIVRIMEVFLIPGDSDSTFSPSLPQPPIPPNLLPQCGLQATLKRLPNPAKVQVSAAIPEGESPPRKFYSECSLMMDSSYAELLRGDVDFIDVVLQSGKNVQHVMDYCDISCPMQMTENLVKWAHLYPICCDIDSSSAIAENLLTLKGASPHFVVVGNMSEFQCKEFNGTKIVGVPSFLKTNTIAVISKNLDVTPLSFTFL